jgi:hypothetical protein
MVTIASTWYWSMYFPAHCHHPIWIFFNNQEKMLEMLGSCVLFVAMNGIILKYFVMVSLMILDANFGILVNYSLCPYYQILFM